MIFMFGRPSGFDFDLLKLGEEIEGRGLGGEFDGGVKERQGACRAVHGGGFVDFGAKERSRSIMEGKDATSGLPEMAEAVAEVGSQCDAGSHGGILPEPEDVLHVVEARRLGDRPFGGAEGTFGEGFAAGGFMG